MINPARYKYLKKEPESNKDISVTPVSRLETEKRIENMKALMRFQLMWDNMADFRRRRRRNKEYWQGIQWNDPIEYEPGHFKSEAQHIIDQGKVPLKNNVISHLVNSVVGTFLENYGLPEVTARVRENQTIGEMNTNMLEYIYQINDMKDLDAKDMIEYTLSGLVCHMVDYHWNDETRRNEEQIISWNPSRVILPGNLQDPRGNDIKCIGVLMDMGLDDVIKQFARSDKEEQDIREIYKNCDEETIFNVYKRFGSPRDTDNLDFYCTRSQDLCRVIQMWEKKSEKCLLVIDHAEGSMNIFPYSDKAALDKMKAERDKEIKREGLDPEKAGMEVLYHNDIFWYVRYYSPFGDILYEGRTPFNHNEHPFTVLMGHLIDGEIHSYVENIIDQQRYINRLITLSDFIISSSAKGVLVFPENAIPKGMNKEDILEQWTSTRGVIFANLKPGMQMPAQIAANCTNIGINELLNMQLTLIRDIGGVHGAMQGKDAKSGQSATLYNQEAANAQTNLRDLMESFISFRRRRDYKAIMIAPQCYDQEFYMAVSGDHEDAQVWNPEVATIAPLYVSISETNNAVAYRSMMNEFLIKAMEMRMTDLKTVLKAGTFPYADKLIRIIEEQEQKAQQEAAQMQAQQMQGQALGQQMIESGASEGQVLQAGADIAQQAVDGEGGMSPEMIDMQAQADQANPDAMQLIQQALG